MIKLISLHEIRILGLTIRFRDKIVVFIFISYESYIEREFLEAYRPLARRVDSDHDTVRICTRVSQTETVPQFKKVL